MITTPVGHGGVAAEGIPVLPSGFVLAFISLHQERRDDEGVYVRVRWPLQWALAAIPAAVMFAFGYWVANYVPTRADRALAWHVSLLLAALLLIVGLTIAFFLDRHNDDISSRLRKIEALNAHIEDNQNRLQAIIVKSNGSPADSLSNQAYLLASDIRAELAENYANPAWGSRRYLNYLNHNFANRVLNVTERLGVVRPHDLFLRHRLLPKNEHDYFQIAANLERIADSL